MCSAFAERDVHFVRDVRYARDVPSGVSGGTHYITATRREQHHYAARHNITCAKGAYITFLQVFTLRSFPATFSSEEVKVNSEELP